MINVIGSFFDTSGYASHTRSLANALAKITKVKLTTNLVPGWERLVNDAELKMIKEVDDFETNLIITNPSFWRQNALAKHNYAFLIWEGDSVPKWIVEECKNPALEKILVVSKHTLEALRKSCEGLEDSQVEDILEKVRMVPHGVDLEVFKPKEMPHPKFTFFANKGFTNMEDRGGIQYLIRAYAEEFDGKDTELLIKINPAYGVPDIKSMFPDLERPDIRFIGDNLHFKDIAQLYNLSDVFVSPTRSEAFNLPCLEALACGKPVIATNFGGQTDFVDKECGWLIDYDLVEVEHELEYEGVKWATPKHEDLKKALRFAKENPEICKAMKERCLGMAKEYTWDRTAKIITGLD